MTTTAELSATPTIWRAPPTPFPAKKPDYSFVWIYISPFVLLVGSVGNALTLCVVNRRALRHSTTRIYLSSMALGDTCALFWRIAPEFLRAARYFDFSTLSVWTCRIEHFSFYTSSDAAIWFMVTFTFDRFIAVCFPLHKKRICKKRTARLVALFVLLTAAVKNLHVFWTRGFNPLKFENSSATFLPPSSAAEIFSTSSTPTIGSSDRRRPSCGRLEAHSFYEENVRPWLAFAFVSLLPATAVIVCNIAIVRTLLGIYSFHGPKKKKEKKKEEEEEEEGDRCQDGDQRQVVVRSSQVHEMTPLDRNSPRKFSFASANHLLPPSSSSSAAGKKCAPTHAPLMCISVSVMFLACVAPSIILSLGKKTWERFRYYHLAKAANNQLACVNHAGNFFLYCMTGERFRCELLSMLRLRRRHRTASVAKDASGRPILTSRSTKTELDVGSKKSTSGSAVGLISHRFDVL